MGCSSKKGKSGQLSIQQDTIPSFANITVERESPSALFPVLLDSTNKFKPEEPIPHFFYNHLLDYEYPWLTDHNSFSLRKLIIDSTRNREVLKAILMSSDLRLKKIADSTEVSNVSLLNALPYRNLSNYELVRLRLSKIK
jgi:hypothetical protein